MKIILGLLFVVIYHKTAIAGIDFDIVKDLSDSSSGNNISISYSLPTFLDEESNTVGILHRWNYSYSSSTLTQNLNSTLPDYEIGAISHDINYEVTFYDDLSLSLGGAQEKFNNEQAIANSLSMGIFYKFADVQLGFASLNSNIDQNQPVIVLAKDIKDQVRVNKKSSTYSLSYQLTDSLLISSNHTVYSYDKNLDNSYLFLTTVTMLDRAGPSVASQIASMQKSSTDLNFSYVLNSNFVFSLGLSSSVEAMSPMSKSNGASFGVDFEFDANDIYYKINSTFYSYGSDGDPSRSGSTQLGLGVGF